MQERAETEREQETYSVRRLPHKPDPGQTHFEGCWREPGHHNCAVVRARNLAAERDRLVEAVEEIVGTGREPICISCNRRVEIAREALEAVEGDGEAEGVMIPGPDGERKVGCEREDGTLNVHPESKTCPDCAAPQDADAEDEYGRQWEIAREAPTSAVADNLAAIPDEKLSVGEQVTRDQAARRLRRGGGESGESDLEWAKRVGAISDRCDKHHDSHAVWKKGGTFMVCHAIDGDGCRFKGTEEECKAVADALNRLYSDHPAPDSEADGE